MATDQSVDRVPVLLYHGVDDGCCTAAWGRERKYWAPAQGFDTQLAAILAGGYGCLGLQDLVADSKGAHRPEQQIALTVDDGRASDFTHIFPRLLRAGLAADFFVNTGSIGQPGFLMWEQVREMSRAGMRFQSHATRHIYLTREPPTRLREDIVSSKKELEDKLGRRVDFLAPPYGDWNSQVHDVALEAGFRAICTGRSRPARCGSTVIDRTVIYRNTSVQGFKRLLACSRAAYAIRATRWWAIQPPKAIVLKCQAALERQG